MSLFLGLDGGGSKSDFVLIDGEGRVLARHESGPSYYLEIGFEALRARVREGIGALLAAAGAAGVPVAASQVRFAFLGLPAYGEDSRRLADLDAIASPLLAPAQYRCGNDMVCGWAGALAGADGINVVAGTGSIAYGEWAGRRARAGGWGELIGDEGSAYWLAREGLGLFTRMSDGRAPRGALYERVRAHFALTEDLDLCAAVYEDASRSRLAQLAPLVLAAAADGDGACHKLLARAAAELAALVRAARHTLAVPGAESVPVSHAGGLFRASEGLRRGLAAALGAAPEPYRLVEPALDPGLGAALQAARLAGEPLTAPALAQLARAPRR